MSGFNFQEEAVMKAILLGESGCCWPLSADLFRPEWPQLHTSVMRLWCGDEGSGHPTGCVREGVEVGFKYLEPRTWKRLCRSS